ncbi:MAG: outer membrane protein assembly factor BamB family protein [Planctomycetota bacterium]
MLPRLLVALTITAAVTATAAAQDWPNWRGPNHNGSTEAEGLPEKFSLRRHIRWKARLPGPGASTPIVVGERIFLTSVDTERERLVALCLNRTDGEVLWQKDAGSGYVAGRGSRTARDRMATYASPSPATDGERVVFFFGNGDLVAYDLEGEELWRRNIQKDYGNFAFQWTFSASPTMWEGKVFLPVLQRDEPVGRGRGGRRGRRGRGGRREQPPAEQREEVQQPKKIESFLLAMDAKTGKTVYKHVRPSPAQRESLESYTTAIPFVGEGGRKELLIAGGDVLTSHDPATGKELWRWGTWNQGHRQRAWRLVPTVVVGGGVAVVCAPKRAPVYAIQLGGKGKLEDSALVWQSEGRRTPVSSDVPTPAFHDGHFYVLSDVRRALSKVRAKDGKVVWTTQLIPDFLWRASPTVADGKVYCMNHNGEVFVVDTADGKIVHRALMGDDLDDDRIRSSIVVAHNNLFVRNNTKLYCVGK